MADSCSSVELCLYSRQKVLRDPETKAIRKLETLYIGYYLELSLFTTRLETNGDNIHLRDADIVVTWTGDGELDELRFPVKPALEELEKVVVVLHHSATQSYDMGDECSAWFSARLGFEVKLVYIGDRSRAVLGSIAPNSEAATQRASFATRLRSRIPFLARPEERLAFNDIAHYLVVTEESNQEVTSRLQDGLERWTSPNSDPTSWSRGPLVLWFGASSRSTVESRWP